MQNVINISRPFLFGVPVALRLLAGKNFRFLSAGVALDEAAPVELAVALPDPRVVVRVVAPAAAHHVASVRVSGSAVAQPAPRPRASRDRVLLAVVRRALQVHQVRVRGLLVAPSLFQAQEGGLAEPRGPDRLHLHRVAVALLQQVADLSELRQGDPAGLGGAGTGDAVTLALQLRSLLQDLLTKRVEVQHVLEKQNGQVLKIQTARCQRILKGP